MTKDKMIGKCVVVGPGGRDCPCCGEPPGKQRRKAKRAKKRSERQKWRKQVNV